MMREALPRLSRTGRQVALRAVTLTVAGVAAAGATTVLAPQAAASTPSAAWAVTSSHAPTSLEAGGVAGYVITATNVGNAPADGGASEIALSDTLPAALTATAIVGVDVANSSFLQCELHTLSCTDPGVVAPGDELIVKITASVSPLATASVINAVNISGGGASGASAREAAGVGVPAGGFGFQSFTAQANNADGSVDTLAGDHPYSATTSFTVDTVARGAAGSVATDRDVKDLAVNLPAGFLGDPSAVPHCPRAIFALPVTDTPASATEQCPIDSQVGVATVALTFGGTKSGRDVYSAPVYNLAPQDGVPADLGFTLPAVAAINVDIAARVRTGGDYGVTATVSDVTELEEVLSTSLTLWGVPGDPGHDAQRGQACSAPLNPQATPQCPRKGGHSFTGWVKPFLTNPTDCAEQAAAPPVTTITADSWQNPGVFTTPLSAASPPVIGCELLQFNPSLSLTPESAQPDTSTGLAVDLSIPQTDTPNALATPQLKDATVKLPPQGLVLSPSAAGGLAGCSDAQIGLSSAGAGSCPPASKIASVQVHTPLLERTLPGAVYLGTPLCAPCTNADAQSGRMLRLFIEVDDPVSGVIVKLPGTVSADPTTGQLTASFLNNPQLPFDDLRLSFKGGSRAALATPSTCGTFTTTSDLSPWSAPFTPDATPSSAFQIAGCGDPNQFAPSFLAGTTNTQAAAFTPFTLTFSRGDADQPFAGLTATLPPGLLARLAGVPLCSDAEANAGMCPAASRVGAVTTGAGPGTHPFFLAGQVFLTGPYRGGPYGLAVEVPALAGPFDLGTVVVRQSLHVDVNDGHVTAVSDPLPSILDGVPLQVRTVSVTLDRPGFTFNPTSCDPMSIDATLISAGGVTAASTSRFQAASCASLPFKPAFSATTTGKGDVRGASLDVKIAQRPGEASIREVETRLPLALPSRLTTLQKACPEAQFAANPAGCPAGSDVGTATATTPILNGPLTGPAYLVSHGGAAFPDLDIVLQGEGIEIVLTGSTDIRRGITISRFETVPDAPISMFELNLPGGRGALLAATRSLCAPGKTVTVTRHVLRRVRGHVRHVSVKVKRSLAEPLLMPTRIVGHNGAVVQQTTRIAVRGCPRPGPKRKGKARRAD
jgi:uncharacterized repeat protein (TIGR01451 family)